MRRHKVRRFHMRRMVVLGLSVAITALNVPAQGVAAAATLQNIVPQKWLPTHVLGMSFMLGPAPGMSRLPTSYINGNCVKRAPMPVLPLEPQPLPTSSSSAKVRLGSAYASPQLQLPPQAPLQQPLLSRAPLFNQCHPYRLLHPPF